MRCGGKFMILFVSERKMDGCTSEVSAHLSKLETGCKLNLKWWRKGRRMKLGRKAIKKILESNVGIWKR